MPKARKIIELMVNMRLLIKNAFSFLFKKITYESILIGGGNKNKIMVLDDFKSYRYNEKNERRKEYEK